MQIKISEIKQTRERQRQTFDEKKLEELALSLRTTGLIQPIVVDDRGSLVCGERRLRAARINGWTEIECVRVGDLDELDREIMEYEENVQRVDISPAERILAQDRLHSLYTEKFGSVEKGWSRSKGAQAKGWRQEDTAELLGVSEAQLSEHLDLAGAVRSDPEVAGLKTREAIVRVVKQKREEGLRKVMVALAVSEESKQDGEVDEDWVEDSWVSVGGEVKVYCADSRTMLKVVESESVDLVMTDPLWGVEFDKKISKGVRAGEVIGAVTEVMNECYRIMKDGTHGFMFFAMKRYVMYENILMASKFAVDPIPLIWYKPGGGFAHDWTIQIKNDYESCLHFFKGRRPRFLKPLNAVHTHSVIRDDHEAAKPVEMLCKLIDATTVEGELVIDPFCGGGSTIEAAIRMGRRCLAVDLNTNCFNMSVLRSRNALQSATRS